MLESANTPPSEDSAAPPAGDEDSRPKSRQEQIDEVAKLLRGDDGKPADDQDDQDDDGKPTGQNEDSQKPVKLESLDAVAEALGVEVSALYDIAIKQPTGPDGEDRSIKLGELADLAKNKGQFELDRLELEDNRQKQEQKFMRAQQQLQEIIGMLPKRAISDDLVNAVVAKMADDEKRERKLTLNVIPEWKDETLEASDRQAMQKHVSAYGFSANYIETVRDHKTLKYIRDNMRRQEATDRALELMRKAPKRDQAPSKPAGKHKAPAEPRKRATSGPKSRDQKVAAVAELLRESEG